MLNSDEKFLTICSYKFTEEASAKEIMEALR